MYAHFGKLNYFSTECIYAPNSYRNHARSFVKDLERIRCINVKILIDLIQLNFIKVLGHFQSRFPQIVGSEWTLYPLLTSKNPNSLLYFTYSTF